MKGGWVINELSSVAGDKIATVGEQCLKSLGMWYNFPVTDRESGFEIQREAERVLRSIDQCLHPGIFQFGCMHFDVTNVDANGI